MSERRIYYAKSSNRFTNGDAAVIGPVLSDLSERGQVTADAVVETAHSKNSPLHEYFEWDDKKAANLHRQDVAKDMIRTVRVRIVEGNAGRDVSAVVRAVAAPRLPAATPAKAVSAMSLPDEDETPQERAKRERLNRRALDNQYYPDDIDEACDIIDILREAVSVFTASETGGNVLNMTKSESRVYRMLETGRPCSKDAIYHLLYGSGSEIEKKIVDVFICKMRKKLPPGEIIETIWGHGYQLVRVAAA